MPAMVARWRLPGQLAKLPVRRHFSRNGAGDGREKKAQNNFIMDDRASALNKDIIARIAGASGGRCAARHRAQCSCSARRGSFQERRVRRVRGGRPAFAEIRAPITSAAGDGHTRIERADLMQAREEVIHRRLTSRRPPPSGRCRSWPHHPGCENASQDVPRPPRRVRRTGRDEDVCDGRRRRSTAPPPNTPAFLCPSRVDNWHKFLGHPSGAEGRARHKLPLFHQQAPRRGKAGKAARLRRPPWPLPAVAGSS